MTMVADELDELADRSSSLATVRSAWLSGTLSAVPDWDPWAVVVRDTDGQLRGAVVLLEPPGDADTDTVILAGCAMGHRSAVLASDPAAAGLLGHMLAQTLQGRERRTRVMLGPLDAATPWLTDFAAMVSGAEIVATDPVPAVQRNEHQLADTYLSSAMRRTLRKAANRAQTDRLHLYARITKDPDEITELLPTLETIHRERDHAQGRRSDLDDASGLRIWHGRLAALTAGRSLELAMLYMDGQLASYVLAILDADAYRVFEGNLDTRWARYAPGRVLEAAVLQRVLDDPAIERLDWMTSVASDRLLAVNALQPACMLRVDYPSV